jgi:hypothetical protein
MARNTAALVGGRPMGKPQAGHYSGYVSTEQEAPSTMDDQVFVVLDNTSSEASVPMPFPAIHGGSLPLPGAKVVVGYDQNNTPYIAWWAGTYSAP